MRKILIASLLAGGSFLLPHTADAAMRATADAAILGAPSIEQAREAGEGARREDRRQDRRRPNVDESVSDGILLIREGGSRNKGRRGP